ncbi:hypothetical protein FLAG1_01159 [Fusarium langsethiae]|uniref:Uncharacterized protein n=1 Tax=Fusarium langsethiae TaxID=179993 RepID=A0A0N0DHQ6_FUSLA|nr:hypothetical protein FLAG1_01159 [Fusarium langsethiae]GKT99152.1 unnamed protein product [Fusarium langsethiae]GKU17441.1 unnamed protein product [Fusarium langsethiae]
MGRSKKPNSQAHGTDAQPSVGQQHAQEAGRINQDLEKQRTEAQEQQQKFQDELEKAKERAQNLQKQLTEAQQKEENRGQDGKELKEYQQDIQSPRKQLNQVQTSPQQDPEQYGELQENHKEEGQSRTPHQQDSGGPIPPRRDVGTDEETVVNHGHVMPRDETVESQSAEVKFVNQVHLESILYHDVDERKPCKSIRVSNGREETNIVGKVDGFDDIWAGNVCSSKYLMDIYNSMPDERVSFIMARFVQPASHAEWLGWSVLDPEWVQEPMQEPESESVQESEPEPLQESESEWVPEPMQEWRQESRQESRQPRSRQRTIRGFRRKARRTRSAYRSHRSQELDIWIYAGFR